MKKIFEILVVLFFLFYIYEFLFTFFGNGHLIEYEVMDGNYTFDVTEEFKNHNSKTNKGNYYISINGYGDTFNYLIYENYKKQSKIVKDVKYYADRDYSCLFVKYTDDKILSDVMCRKDGYYYPYKNISNPSSGLINFISSLSEQGYNVENYQDNLEESYTLGDVTIYKNNFYNSHLIGVENNNKLYKITLNKRSGIIDLPLTGNNISTFIKNYYIIGVANDEAITGFIIYDINDKTNKALSIEMSKQSYFLGNFDNRIYIYDPINHKEYQINIKEETIEEVGNKDLGIKYYTKNEWKTVSYKDFEEKKLEFDKNTDTKYINENFDVIKKDNNKNGYYYLLKQIGDKYQVYRTSKKNQENITYLFTTTNKDSLQFIQNVVYYQNAKQIMYYSDSTGNRNILSCNDFINYNTKYNAYIKKRTN